MMMCFSKWLSATLAIALLASSAAADTVLAGKIKSINADNKTFVFTDNADKDHTAKFADDVVINRGGKEGKSDLKVGDAVSVCHDAGLLKWTAHYILVHEGTTKDSTMWHGTFKSYNADKKQLGFINSNKTDAMYAIGDATVRINMKSSTAADLSIGDQALIISNTNGDKLTTLRSVMVQRAK
jgi:hypothetical protein